MSSSLSSRPSDAVSALLVDASECDRASIAQHVSAYPTPLLERLVAADCRVRPLAEGERYRDVSAALRRLGADVDAWPVPPADLFVVEERTVYLRSRSPMTIGHEVAHAIDCALGDGIYRSGYDTQIRSAFAAARSFVTPYAATGLDEYFALVRRRAQRRAFAVAARNARTLARMRSRDAYDRRRHLRRLARNAGVAGVAQ